MFGFFKKKEEQAPVDFHNTELRLEFSQRLQAVTNKIHAADNLDELMLDMSEDICGLFNCDRLTLYAVSGDKKCIFSKVKTGLNISKELMLPIDETSVAGYVALSERTIRIRDVYDEKELKSISHELQFRKEVDSLTGYRTKQMLTAPIINPSSQTVMGVLQLLNNRNGEGFDDIAEEGLQELCKTIGVAFVQRLKAAARMRSKYEPLLMESIISTAELDLAINWARRKNVDVEEALVSEFQVKPEAIGKALAKSYNLPYEPFIAGRQKPAEAIRKVDRKFVERYQSIPIEEKGHDIVLMTTDPEMGNRIRMIRETFPYNNLYYRVTTQREFRQTVDQFFPA
ncbi:MAG: GAF domain-containing protein [Burkholderiales bacterium]|nr:GAF domain-containing protein [Burkholderiales bacterium]